jgi:hypothetical protein
MKNAGNVNMHVIGGTRSGKSRCLFGDRDRYQVGLVELFAERYFNQRNVRGTALIEVSIYQVCDEEACDLLSPQQNCLPLRFSPTCGPWLDKVSRHLAKNKDEFSTLLRDALSVKAAFLLLRDKFPDSTHLCIRCLCSHEASPHQPPAHEGTVSFVEFGSNAMTGLQFNESEEVPIETHCPQFPLLRNIDRRYQASIARWSLCKK